MKPQTNFTFVFPYDCAADGCYNQNMGDGKQMCKVHQKMYDEGKPFKAFYGKTVLKKIYQKIKHEKPKN